MPSIASPYRDGRDALRARLEDLEVRLAELDHQLARHHHPLPRLLRRRLGKLRAAAAPADGRVAELVRAEAALVLLEQQVDEGLGLAADLQRTLRPLLPSRSVVLRWAGCCASACGLLLALVVQLGLGDFMLRALGAQVLRADAAIPCGRVAFEATRAAHGAPPEHAVWVDPQP